MFSLSQRAAWLAVFSSLLLFGQYGCATNSATSTNASIKEPAPESKQVSSLTPNALVIDAIEEMLEMPVSLDILKSRSDGKWVFMSGVPLTENGQQIDYSNTLFANDVAEGYFDDGFVALLNRDPSSGLYSLIELSVGATDVPFIDWSDKYGVPAKLIFDKSY